MRDGEIVKDNKKTGKRQRYIGAIVSVFLLSLIVFYAGFFNSLVSHRSAVDIPPAYRHIYVGVGEHSYRADIADTESLRELGLSFRSSLDSGEGMFFIFEKAGIYPFWMKDMKFPIDILWLDEDGRINFVVSDASPSSYPHLFTPSTRARLVLEIPAGSAEKENVQIGDKIIFDKETLKSGSK